MTRVTHEAPVIETGNQLPPSQPARPESEDVDPVHSPVGPGASRPRGARFAVWLGSALVLGALLATSAAGSGPLDDPDPAKQRSGMLDVVGPRSPAPEVAPGVPAAGRPTVVFFVRPAQVEALSSTLAAADAKGLAIAADLALVVSAPGPRAADAPNDAPAIVTDGDGRLADGYGMRRPRDGGPPVGYAVVGPDQNHPVPDRVPRRRRERRRGAHHGGRPLMSGLGSAATATSHRRLRIVVGTMAAAAVEVFVYRAYLAGDGSFHWFTHFFAGASVALVVMTLVTLRTRRPVPLPLLWPVLGLSHFIPGRNHLAAMGPDLMFVNEMAHRRSLALFLLALPAHELRHPDRSPSPSSMSVGLGA